ncbi:MAG: malectin [Phormidesmis sp.]
MPNLRPDSEISEFASDPLIDELSWNEQESVAVTKDPTGTDLTGGDNTDFVSEGMAGGLIESDQVSPQSTDLPEAVRINAGGANYADALGQTWLSDQFFQGNPAVGNASSLATTSSEIAGTLNDTLYQSERYAKTLSYHIPVANGTYDVNLHFAEIFWAGNEQRLFDVAIEDNTLSTLLDIHASVGQNQALQQDFQSIVVTDGMLDIHLNAIADHAKLSGLEVLAQSIATDEAAIATEAPTESPIQSLPLGPAALTSGATVRYITPNGAGDGSSWEQAANIFGLESLVAQSAPGDEVWIAGDLGSYNLSSQVGLYSGGTAAAPVYIRGVASQGGGNDTPLFVGNRAEGWTPGAADGNEIFRLLNGANYLHFSNIDFKNVGNGAFRLGGNLTGITLEDMQANNVRRFVENFASSGAKDASISDLTIRDIGINGFSKGAIRLQYNTHDVLIEDVIGDSQGQDGDNFAVGIHLDGSVNNVMHRRVTMNNALQTAGDSDYWNGDGFVAEDNTYNITYEDTYAAGSSDGGYDLKSDNTVLIRAGAADNKRNFRIWGSTTMYDIFSDEPMSKGGIGAQTHVHVVGKKANVSIFGGTFSGDKSVENTIFEVDNDGNLTVDGALITDNAYTLQATYSGNLQMDNMVFQA